MFPSVHNGSKECTLEQILMEEESKAKYQGRDSGIRDLVQSVQCSQQRSVFQALIFAAIPGSYLLVANVSCLKSVVATLS